MLIIIIIVFERLTFIVYSIDNDYLIDRILLDFLVSNFDPKFSLLIFILALPQAVRIEPSELSHIRRPIHETEIDVWQEPDSTPKYSFMLRPRFIQEGIGCKLICCVSGKPTPKVNHHHCYSDCFDQ